MAGPKMGNTYPNAISSYPSWVAHATPYTAEWGNSVGFEFYKIEYELGVDPRGVYASVKARLDGMPSYVGFNYWARGYYNTAAVYVDSAGSFPLNFDVSEHDADGCFDLSSRRYIYARVTGFYKIVWNFCTEFSASAQDTVFGLTIYRRRGGIDWMVGQDSKMENAHAKPHNLTFNVVTSVHMVAGERLYANFYISNAVALWFYKDTPNSNMVDFRLITAGEEN